MPGVIQEAALPCYQVQLPNPTHRTLHLIHFGDSCTFLHIHKAELELARGHAWHGMMRICNVLYVRGGSPIQAYKHKPRRVESLKELLGKMMICSLS